MASATLTDLIEEIRQQNAISEPRLKNLEADGRNSRRHLLEMKKTMFKIEDSVRMIAEPSTDLSGFEKEQLAEQKSRDEKMIAALEKLSAGSMLGGGKSQSDLKSSAGGIMGTIAGLFKGAGLGIGAAFLGIAALGAVGVYLASEFADIDTAKIKQNVIDLLSITSELNDGNALATFGEGGLFFLVMTGIGTGLAAFSIGAGSAAVLQKFETEGWVDKLKANVVNLLSLKDELGGNVNLLFNGMTFGLAMTGIGLGLAAFSIGAGGAAVVDTFSTGNWSQNIVDNVTTLLSIKDVLGGTGALIGGSGIFALSMGGIALGLAAFALGQGVAGLSGGMTAVLEQFNGGNWAENIKSDVQTLLSIPSLPGVAGDTAGFIVTMGAIASGLVAFALGKGANVGADSWDSALGYFTGEGDFAQRIKDQVNTLLSIVQENEGVDTARFVATMGGMAAGILAFTASDAIGTLADAGQKILGFFGVRSPFSKIMEVAENADKLQDGARALRSIGRSLRDFSDISFDGSNFNMEEFADDLKDSVPTIEKAVMGDSGGWFGTRIAGLANTGDSYQQAARNIEVLMEALDLGSSGGGSAAPAGGGTTVINNYYGGGRTVLPGDGAPGRGRFPRP